MASVSATSVPPKGEEGMLVQVEPSYFEEEQVLGVNVLFQQCIETASWGPHTMIQLAETARSKYGDFVGFLVGILALSKDDPEHSYVELSGEGATATVQVLPELQNLLSQTPAIYWFVPAHEVNIATRQGKKQPVLPRASEDQQPKGISLLLLRCLGFLYATNGAVKKWWRTLRNR